MSFLDANLRQQAEEQLNTALQTQMGQFMLTLTQALASEGFEILGRQAAGLYLKNVLDAKDSNLQAQKIQAWDAMDPALRDQIKQGALATLQSQEPIARHTGAQVVAKLGVIDLPRKMWPELLSELLTNVTAGHEGTKHATLETLGYLCDGLEDDDEIDQEDTNRILTAIIDGVRSDRPIPIRLAGITALRHSLEFINENFSRDEERNHIMQVVCEATQCPEIKVRVVAFECIATIATLYYEYVQPYMTALYEVSFKAVRTDQHEVGLMSLEFWSSICDVEISLLEEAEYAKMEGRPVEEECQNYIRAIYPQLIPLLTETLLQQEEDQDEGTWNMAMAGATCLALIAQTVKEDCIELTMAFITANIGSAQWKNKEAAIMAFGSILEGPSTVSLAPIIQQALPLLMNCMTDQNIIVRDTTAWAIGRICDCHAHCISGDMLPPLMTLLLQGLDQEPRVARSITFAIHNLAKAFEESAAAAALLQPYFTGLFDKLLKTANRQDSTENNLRFSAYEALSMLIQVGPPQVTSHIMTRLPTILEQLEAALQRKGPDGKASDEDAYLQSLLCGNLLVTIQRVSEGIAPFADRIMQNLLVVLQQHNTSAEEEGFMAVGALASVMNMDFLRYLDFVAPLLMQGLNNNEDYSVCFVAVGVVGDLCRALEKHVQKYCDDIVGSLLNSLRNNDLNRTIKPPMIGCFGEIALAIEGDFERYLGPVMHTLIEAALACQVVDPEDEDMVDYMNEVCISSF